MKLFTTAMICALTAAVPAVAQAPADSVAADGTLTPDAAPAAASGGDSVGSSGPDAAPGRELGGRSASGRAVPRGVAPLGVERSEPRRVPLGATVGALSDLRSVFAPGLAQRARADTSADASIAVDPDTSITARAQRFVPREGVPVGMPVDPSEAVRASKAESMMVSAIGPVWGSGGPAFLQEQLRHDRVVNASLDAKFRLRTLFEEKGLDYPSSDLFIRIFKEEQLLEVWARDAAADDYTLVERYEVCAVSGRVGPKRRLQDFQAPEGFYYIEGFNPQSEFHLSLRLNYPNAADRMRGQHGALGGDIYIHGGCDTEGCFPLRDEGIRELYWLAVQARAAGQEAIPVHVFPTRMTADRMRWLRDAYASDRRLVAFWENLREGYAMFERTRRVPQVMVDGLGRYRFSESPARSTPGR